MSSELTDQGVADGIRRLMKARKVTLQKLAAGIGVPYRTLQNYLHGESRFPATVFLQVCEYLGVERSPILSDNYRPAHEDLYDAVFNVLRDVFPHLNFADEKVVFISPPVHDKTHNVIVGAEITRALANAYDRYRRETISGKLLSGPPRVWRE